MGQDLTKFTLEELAENTGEAGSQRHVWVQMEMMRRQTLLQESDQGGSRDRETHTASFTYMLWSVVVLALASVATVAVTWLKG